MEERLAKPLPNALLLLALAAGACSAGAYVDDADREVAGILGEAGQRVLGGRADWIVRPEAPPEPPAGQTPADDAAPGAATSAAEAQPANDAAAPAPPEVFDLPRALLTAVHQNREFLTRRESLYQQGLSISLTRFQFGPQFASAINYVWPDREGGIAQHGAGLSLAASQILPTGGTLALTGGFDTAWPYGPNAGPDGYGSSLGVSLTQPLLRGAGYEVSHESLTSAERQLTYAVRDFELYRENFTIDVARRFFDLTSQRKTLANEDANYEAAVFDRGKAEALQQVGRNTEQEVFRARRREIEAKDQLINARAAYDRTLDTFKILLGLPTSVAIEIADVEPSYEPVRFTNESAIAAARHNRLDLITERQQLEDAERGVRLAENGLLPDFDLVANYGLNGGGNDLGSARPDIWNSSVALQFAIPLQQKGQRNAYRSARIGLEQSRRGLQLREDQLELDIRDALRNLRSTEERITLQEQQIEQEQRAVTVTQIRYEAGKLENRDLLEARQALVNAQNALIRLKADHFTARLSLLRDMGIFFVDDNGIWQ